MLEIWWVILIGLLGGVAVGLQSPIAGRMGEKIGGTASSVIVHLSGLIVSLVMLVLRGGEKIKEWPTLPWYMLVSGAFGLVLIQTITVTLPRLGGAAMIALIIVGQLVTGLAIDTFGWFGVAARPLEFTRLAGAALLLIGGYLVVK